jgi:hypothetical protein
MYSHTYARRHGRPRIAGVNPMRRLLKLSIPATPASNTPSSTGVVKTSSSTVPSTRKTTSGSSGGYNY